MRITIALVSIFIAVNIVLGHPGRNGFEKSEISSSIIADTTSKSSNGKANSKLEGDGIKDDKLDSTSSEHLPHHHHHVEVAEVHKHVHPVVKHIYVPVPIRVPIFKPLHFRKHFSFHLGNYWPFLRIHKGFHLGPYHHHHHHGHGHGHGHGFGHGHVIGK